MAEISEFRKGAKALFDSLLYRAANHWHGNPEVNKQCDYDNNLIYEWASDALHEISPDDYNEWICIHEQARKIRELEKEIKILKSND